MTMLIQQLMRQSAEQITSLKDDVIRQSAEQITSLKDDVSSSSQLLLTKQAETQQALEQLVGTVRQDLQLQIRDLEQDLNGKIGTIENHQSEVSKTIDSLSQRIDAVQREVYNRISGVEGGPAGGIGAPRGAVPAQVENSTRVVARCPVFDGKIPFKLYLTQFNMVSDLNHWSEAERAMHLAINLAGPAVSILNNVPAHLKHSFAHIVNALMLRFDDTHCSELARAKLACRSKQRHESYVAYGSDIESLTRTAFPLADEIIVDQLSRDYFINGISDRDMRTNLKLYKSSNFAELLNRCIEIDAINQAERLTAGDHRSHVRFVTRADEETEGLDGGEGRRWGDRGRLPYRGRSRSPEPMSGGLEARVMQLEKSLHGLEKGSSQGQLGPNTDKMTRADSPHKRGNYKTGLHSSNLSQIVCFACGKLGHVQKFCRNKRNNTRPTAESLN